MFADILCSSLCGLFIDAAIVDFVIKMSEWVSRFLTARQHKLGYSVPFEVKLKADGIYRQVYRRRYESRHSSKPKLH